MPYDMDDYGCIWQDMSHSKQWLLRKTIKKGLEIPGRLVPFFKPYFGGHIPLPSPYIGLDNDSYLQETSVPAMSNRDMSTTGPIPADWAFHRNSPRDPRRSSWLCTYTARTSRPTRATASGTNFCPGSCGNDFCLDVRWCKYLPQATFSM